jgi:hypothetical protein
VSSEITCFCDLFAGFTDVALLALRSQDDGSLVMRIETRPRIVGCPTCGSIAQSKGRSPVELASTTPPTSGGSGTTPLRRDTCHD